MAAAAHDVQTRHHHVFAGSRAEKPQVTRGYGLASATASAWP
jgi:alpha-D-ribose 1-methylphosphonate 5-triphosphate synthase subunit PhnI